MLLDATITVDGLLHLGELISIVGAGFAAFWKLNNRVDVLKADLKNSKEEVEKLEQRLNNSETKLEDKITNLAEKIDRLPKDIIELFRQLK